MPQWVVWLAPLLATLVTVVLVWPLKRFLVDHDLIDVPDPRRSHLRPTPRGGGLAMAAGLCLAVVVLIVQFDQPWLVLVPLLALTVLGWLDDRHDMKVGWRLIMQLAIALVLVLWIGAPTVIQWGPVAIESSMLWAILAVVAVVWLINLHNFMDGSDGLAAGQGIWSGLAFGLAFGWNQAWFEALLAFSLAGACLGFLYWNRPPARIFMGDTGSVLLGGSVAGLALIGAESGSVSIWLSMIICSLFVVDATATLARRLLVGEQWYTAHRSHAYQRLIISGWTHGQVLTLYGLVNGLIVLPLFLVGLTRPEHDFWLALVVIVLLVAGWYFLQSSTNGDKQINHD